MRQAHVIDVDMGYGHARAAHALRHLSDGQVLTANNYAGMPSSDRLMWKRSRELYETISRFKTVPLVGDLAFSLMDQFQQIAPFYPRRDLSRPSIQLRQIYRMIKHGFGAHLIDKLRRQPLPLVTTFFTVAFMADEFDFPGDIFLVTTDADIARPWAPFDPQKSKIKYIAANGRCRERLMLYGVPSSRIFLTGFPLPKELIGGYPERKLQKDLLARVANLDPQRIFWNRYQKTVEARLGCRCVLRSRRPLTVTFSVGGAGAQQRIGLQLLRSLARDIRAGRLRLALFAGVRQPVAEAFRAATEQLGLSKEIGRGVLISCFDKRATYFDAFNRFLVETDVLITKPSELSFYTALGLPIIMAPPIGSQERFNATWLQYVGGGVPMADPRYANEWLYDWINSGGVARMAWSGYVEAPTHGVYRIEDLVLGQKSSIHSLPLIV